MIRFLSKILILSTVLAFSLGGVSPTLAAEHETADISAVLAVADEELTSEEKFTRASEGLEKALELSLAKVDSLTAELSGREFAEGSVEASMRDNFLMNLASYNTYYREKLEILDGITTLEETQELAREIKTYRTDVYSPDMENIVEFALVFYSADVVRVAEDRLSRVSADIEELRTLGFLEEGAFSEELSEIGASIETSKNLQRTARELVLGTSTTERLEETALTQEATSSITAVDEETVASSTPIEVDDSASAADEESAAVENPREMLEESLFSVKEVYAIFVEVSENIRDTLGIE